MPQINRFKKNAVLYLTGELPKYIYLVKEGKVILLSNQNEQDSSLAAGNFKKTPNKIINKGEFFGLFSALGAYPRQEDAVTHSDVELLMFNEKEFENLVGTNPNLSLRLMRMLSKELRTVHRKTREILAREEAVLLDEGLYSYIQMYDKNNDKEKVIYIATQFMKAHPTSKHAGKVKEILSKYQE